MEFSRWLTAWLSRHPLQSPSEVDRSRLTAGVMARVRSETAARPASAWAGLLAGWPRLALPLAAAAAVLVAVRLHHPSDARLAAEVVQGTELLAELDEPVNGWLLPDDVDTLAQDLERADLLVLAEVPQGASDDSWITETMDILNQLDQDAPEDGVSTEPTDDQWLQELEILDEQDLAARS